MENAIDALHIAMAVMIFVLALSISIHAFGEVRQSSQIILDYKDREYDYTYVEENGTTRRTVGIETIVPAIYKAYKENYKIVFDTTKIGQTGLYQKKSVDGTDISIFSIDLENEVLGSDSQKEEFITAILYGKNSKSNFSEWVNIKDKFYRNLGIKLNDDGIYDKIKEKTFIEKLGVYYQEEIKGQSNTPYANKTAKRVITYADN